VNLRHVISALGMALTTELVVAQQPGNQKTPYSRRLTLADFHFGDAVNATFGLEFTRLDELCRFHEFDCLQQNFRPTRVRVAIVRRRPLPDSQVVGQIVASLAIRKDVEQWGHVGIGLEFEPEGSLAPMMWIADVGDWGYGIHFTGVVEHSGWINPSTKPFPDDAWVSTRTNPNFEGFSGSIEDSIVGLSPLELIDGRQKRLIPDGSYKILKIRNDTVWFRPEVPSDYPCGEDVKPPKKFPTTLKAPAAQFFEPDGTPRFQQVYTKGC
jgi:hypothetical protein